MAVNQLRTPARTGADAEQTAFPGRRALPPTAPLLAGIGLLLTVLAVLWVQARPWDSRFVNRPAALGALSGALSLAGTVLLSVTIVLSARLRFVERSAGGLDRVYRFHHRLGAVSFTLLALHPSDQVLLWTQRMLGLLLLPAAYHVFRIGGDTGSDTALRAYVGAIVAAAVIALAVHTVAGRFLSPHHHYVVDAVRALNPQITEISLHPAGRSMPFVAGQFAFLRFAHQPIGGEAHPYSMASAPGEATLRFTIKHLGDYTAHIGEVAAGANATVEGPYGRFSYRSTRGKRQAWIAGGIGIAPFLSMAADLDTDAGYAVTLFYGYADDGPPAILAELTALAAEHPNLDLVLVDQHRDGVIGLPALRARLGTLDGIEFLLCGPPPMLHALQRQLADAAVPKRRIHFEEFDFA